jgi:hypothetical protein
VDARSEGGGYGHKSDYQTCTRVFDREKTGKTSGENPCAEARAPASSLICVSWSPSPALDMTGDLDKEERHVGGRGSDL